MSSSYKFVPFVCINCRSPLDQTIHEKVLNVSLLCSDCKKTRLKEITVFDRNRRIGAIPKNLKERYGQDI